MIMFKGEYYNNEELYDKTFLSRVVDNKEKCDLLKYNKDYSNLQQKLYDEQMLYLEEIKNKKIKLSLNKK